MTSGACPKRQTNIIFVEDKYVDLGDEAARQAIERPSNKFCRESLAAEAFGHRQMVQKPSPSIVAGQDGSHKPVAFKGTPAQPRIPSQKGR